jgi:hypothetical protein
MRLTPMNVSNFYADTMFKTDECSMGQHSSSRSLCVCVCVCEQRGASYAYHTDQWIIIQTTTYLQANDTRNNLIIWDTFKKGRYIFFGIPLLLLLLLLLLLGVRVKPRMYHSLLAYCTARFLNVPISCLRDATARLPTRSALQRRKLERSNLRY